MTALGQVESHEGISRIQDCHLHCEICLGAGMRLDICIFSIKQFAESVNRSLLDLIDYLTTPVISFSRITLRIFVRAD